MTTCLIERFVAVFLLTSHGADIAEAGCGCALSLKVESKPNVHLSRSVPPRRPGPGLGPREHLSPLEPVGWWRGVACGDTSVGWAGRHSVPVGYLSGTSRYLQVPPGTPTTLLRCTAALGGDSCSSWCWVIGRGRAGSTAVPQRGCKYLATPRQ